MALRIESEHDKFRTKYVQHWHQNVQRGICVFDFGRLSSTDINNCAQDDIGELDR